MTTAEEFLDFVAAVLGRDRTALSLETAYGTVPEWDSVMHLRLVMEIEGEYGVDIPMEKVPDIRTLAAFYGFVNG